MGGAQDTATSFKIHSGKGKSSEAVDFTVSPCSCGKAVDTTTLRKAHGILMITAWAIMLPFGINLARYRKWLKALGKDVKGTELWFRIHYPLQCTGALLAAVGVSLASTANSGGTGAWTTHQFFGIVVITLTFIQPFLGILRPHGDSPKRKLWFWAHRGCGSVAFCMAIPTIMFGGEKLNGADGVTTGFTVGWALWCATCISADFFGGKNGGMAKGAHKAAAAVAPDGGGDGAATTAADDGNGMSRKALFACLFFSGGIMIASVIVN